MNIIKGLILYSMIFMSLAQGGDSYSTISTDFKNISKFFSIMMGTNNKPSPHIEPDALLPEGEFLKRQESFKSLEELPISEEKKEKTCGLAGSCRTIGRYVRNFAQTAVKRARQHLKYPFDSDLTDQEYEDIMDYGETFGGSAYAGLRLIGTNFSTTWEKLPKNSSSMIDMLRHLKFAGESGALVKNGVKSFQDLKALVIGDEINLSSEEVRKKRRELVDRFGARLLALGDISPGVINGTFQEVLNTLKDMTDPEFLEGDLTHQDRERIRLAIGVVAELVGIPLYVINKMLQQPPFKGFSPITETNIRNWNKQIYQSDDLGQQLKGTKRALKKLWPIPVAFFTAPTYAMFFGILYGMWMIMPKQGMDKVVNDANELRKSLPRSLSGIPSQSAAN